MPRLYVLTEEPVLGFGVAAVLGKRSDWNLTVLSSAADLLREPSGESVEVVLMDFEWNSFGRLVSIRKSLPECKVILWVRNLPLEAAFQAIRIGVLGILRKTEPVETVVECLSSVASGRPWLDKALASGVLGSRAIALTQRESQLVRLVSDGLKNKEISQSLCISEATVRVYMSSLFRKLGVKDRYELALYGFKNMASSESFDTRDAEVKEMHSLMISRPATRDGSRQKRAKVV